MQELKLEPGVDTLSRWIAHYITEQIAIAESATGEEKAGAEERCFNSIMRLWQHRYALPNARSPFKEFTSIFETLQKLNPDNQKPFYIDWQYRYDKILDENSSDSDDARSWLRIALGIDRAARVLIESVLRQSAGHVMNLSLRDWLNHSSGHSKDFDVQVIMELVGNLEADDGLNSRSVKSDDQESTESFLNVWSKEEIKERIKYLEAFMGTAALLHSTFQEKLGESV